jgi:hypothetical protein
VTDKSEKIVAASLARVMTSIEDDIESPYFPEACAKCKDKKCRVDVLVDAANLKIRQQAWLN